MRSQHGSTRGVHLTRRGWLLFGALSILWGIPYLLIKVAVAEVSPAALVFLRTAIGTALLLPLVPRAQLRPLLRRWRPLVAFTVVELAVPWYLLSDAERRLSSSFCGLMIAAVPLVGAVMALLTGHHERIDGRRLTGLVVGLGGVVALLGIDVSRGDALAVLEVAVVVVGYATGPLIVSRHLADVPSLGVVTASLALCAIAYAPVALLQLPPAIPPAPVVTAIAALGILCTAIAFVVFFQLIAEAGPVRATVVTYLNPAVAVVLGVVLLRERFTVGTAVAFVLILGGSFLATRGPGAAAEVTARE
jgi:drug/metabolite transporter (DMT)-like permease